MNEYPPPLVASVKGSFAYVTIKDRLPVTITKGIDFIARNRNQLIKRFSNNNENEISEDIKSAIERLSQLRYELVTDKPLRLVEDDTNDTAFWNESISELIQLVGIENATWFKAPWIFTECYVYRRIREAMQLCSTAFKDYDPYEEAKIESHEVSHENIRKLITVLCPLDFKNEEKKSTERDQKLLRDRFHLIIQAQLWANKNDLSLSSGEDVSSKVKDLVFLIESLKPNILCNHIDSLWNHILSLKSSTSSPTKKMRVDIVLDNCAIELTSDLILCDFLLRNDLVDEIHLHAKQYSWFISDVLQFDFDYLIRLIQKDNSILMSRFLSRLNTYLQTGMLIFKCTDPFWTSPYTFDRMSTKAEKLYADLSANSSLVFLKGDLNYRKLIGDLAWPFDTPLSVAVRQFRPTSLCAIRTLKADLCANLDTNVETNPNYKQLCDAYAKDDLKWMITGDYGLIQFLNA